VPFIPRLEDRLGQALREVRGVTSVAGRYTQVSRRGVDIRLLLAKNPAGWLEALDVVAPAPAPVEIGVVFIASIESTSRWGVCTATRYWMPRLSSQ